MVEVGQEKAVVGQALMFESCRTADKGV